MIPGQRIMRSNRIPGIYAKISSNNWFWIIISNDYFIFICTKYSE